MTTPPEPANQGDQIGRLSPIGCLLTTGSFMKITELAQLLAIFSMEKLCLNFVKNGLGYLLGDFIHGLIWSPCFQPSLCTFFFDKLFDEKGFERNHHKL
jgi:hypothetical protein